MHDVFYHPPATWFGDCMPFYWDGTYYLYHQRDTRRPGPFGEPFGWALVSTTDFVTFVDHGEVLLRGADDAQDQFIFAGSVLRGPDAFYAFYTGYNRDFPAQGRASQVLMVARSEDLLTWEKTDRALVVPQDGYDPDDWRDPFVLWDEEGGRYLMILGARRTGPKTQASGSTVAFSSTDLETWEFEGDFWAPEFFTMHEMPDLYRQDGRWYLLTTEYSSESKTNYRVADSLAGPWLMPFDDAFDGRAYYAARSAGTDDERYLFGWVPTKAGEDDRALWEWGGTLLVHQVRPRADGSLGVSAPAGVLEAFGDGATRLDGPTVISAVDGVAQLDLGPVEESVYRVRAEVSFAPGTRAFGLRFGADAETGESYRYAMWPERRRLTMDRWPSYPWPRYENRGLERPVLVEPSERHVLELLVDGSVACLYLDDVALSTRTYQVPGRGLALDVLEGALEVHSVEVFTRGE
ncbi:glycosyl hydrolase family 32 [Salana multivorans]